MVSGARQAIVTGFIAVLLMILPGNAAKAEAHTPGGCQQAYGSLDPLDTLPDRLQTDVAGGDLHTASRYDLLAGRLLVSGFVEGSRNGGGVALSERSPNGCGVALSAPAVIEWQNQYNEAIVDASGRLELPPRLVKAVIAVESQFWPGSDWGKGEIGLGQLTDAGADMLLAWRPEVYRNICSQVYGSESCESAYVDLEPWERAAVRGKLLRTIDATCSTCKGGVDLARANQSISLLAEAIAGSCQQTAYLVRRSSGKSPAQHMSYEDFMRLALANYQVGSGCIDEALRRTSNPGNWSGIAINFSPGCRSGIEYIHRIEEQLAP